MSKKPKFTLKGCKMNSVMLWIVFNIFRIIPSILFGIPAFIFYGLCCLFNRKKYLENKAKWEKASLTYDGLIDYFRNTYKYKYDLIRGFCDHDSSIFEWCWAFGDCDDVALYGRKALKKLGFEAYRIGIVGFKSLERTKPDSSGYTAPKLKNKLSSHFDCLWVKRDELGEVKTVCLLNYGMVITANSVEDAIDKLSYYFSCFPVGHVKICKTW